MAETLVSLNPLIGSAASTLPKPSTAPVVGQYRGVTSAQADMAQEADRFSQAQMEFQTAKNSVTRATQSLNQAKAELNALQSELQQAQVEQQASQQELAGAKNQAQQYQAQIAQARTQAQAELSRMNSEMQSGLATYQSGLTQLTPTPQQVAPAPVVQQATPAQQPTAPKVLSREDYSTAMKALNDKYAWAEQLLKESTYFSPEKSEGGVVTSKPIPGREADYERARQGIFAKERELKALNSMPNWNQPTAQATPTQQAATPAPILDFTKYSNPNNFGGQAGWTKLRAEKLIKDLGITRPASHDPQFEREVFDRFVGVGDQAGLNAAIESALKWKKESENPWYGKDVYALGEAFLSQAERNELQQIRNSARYDRNVSGTSPLQARFNELREKGANLYKNSLNPAQVAQPLSLSNDQLFTNWATEETKKGIEVFSKELTRLQSLVASLDPNSKDYGNQVNELKIVQERLKALQSSPDPVVAQTNLLRTSSGNPNTNAREAFNNVTLPKIKEKQFAEALKSYNNTTAPQQSKLVNQQVNNALMAGRDSGIGNRRSSGFDKVPVLSDAQLQSYYNYRVGEMDKQIAEYLRLAQDGAKSAAGADYSQIYRNALEERNNFKIEQLANEAYNSNLWGRWRPEGKVQTLADFTQLAQQPI